MKKILKDCMGDRRCNDLCPDVFESDEYGPLFVNTHSKCSPGTRMEHRNV